jgi:hypothetical protein
MLNRMTSSPSPRQWPDYKIRACIGCAERKHVSEFSYSERLRSHAARCRKCTAAKVREYRALNRERTAQTQRDARLRARSGLSSVQYDALLERQGGCCLVCYSPPRSPPVGGDRPARFAVLLRPGQPAALVCSACAAVASHISTPTSRDAAVSTFLSGVTM